MDKPEKDLKQLESEHSALNDKSEIITEAGEDDGGKTDCPQQAPCVVR